eukprot:206888_1
MITLSLPNDNLYPPNINDSSDVSIANTSMLSPILPPPPTNLPKIQGRKQKEETPYKNSMIDFRKECDGLKSLSHDFKIDHIKYLHNSGQYNEMMNHFKSIKSIMYGCFSSMGGLPVRLKQTTSILSMEDRAANASSSNNYNHQLKKRIKKSKKHVANRAQSNIASHKRKLDMTRPSLSLATETVQRENRAELIQDMENDILNNEQDPTISFPRIKNNGPLRKSTRKRNAQAADVDMSQNNSNRKKQKLQTHTSDLI